MKTITTTNARKQIAKLIESVRETGDVFAIGRRNQPEVLLIKFPTDYNASLSDITNVNTYSESFSFLDSEPDLYSVADLKKSYV
ncbi:type II toxin-antitoxin system Phd/YefM family antitoxin [Candidatus Kaiserbacteria bacterium]|nr:type II toxin-antitoxin system Phd/YefM family antitoxin [Candidatus Kaiserbacteria bacterium]